MVTLNIGGINFTNQLYRGDLVITDILTSAINNISFTILRCSGEGKPSEGNEVILTNASGIKLFAGYLVSVQERLTTTVSGNAEYYCEGVDYTQLLMHKRVAMNFTDTVCSGIIGVLLDRYVDPSVTKVNVLAGPTIESMSFNYINVADCLRKLRDATNYDWYLDYDKDLHFFSSGENIAPESLSESSRNFEDLDFAPDISQLRNVIYIKGGLYTSDPYTQNIITNGANREWGLIGPPGSWGSLIEITASGIFTRTVGADPLVPDNNYEYMFNYNEKILKASSWFPTSSGTQLTAIYSPDVPLLSKVKSQVSIDAMIALQGGDGIYEYVIDDNKITSKAEAKRRAKAELTDYADPIITGEFITDTRLSPGIWKAGQLVTISLPSRGISGNYLIQQVDWYLQDMDNFKIKVKFGGRLIGMMQFLESLIKKESDVVSEEVIDVVENLDDGIILSESNTLTLFIEPHKWSNDAGTTPNKGKWNKASYG